MLSGKTKVKISPKASKLLLDQINAKYNPPVDTNESTKVKEATNLRSISAPPNIIVDDSESYSQSNPTPHQYTNESK